MAQIPIHSGENIGYGAAGASRNKRAMRGMTAKSYSPREDIDLNNYTMRQRLRILYMSAPPATSAINTNRTNVIGSGLKLKSRINREWLGLSKEEADRWEMKTEAEFGLWGNDKRNCDAIGISDFNGLQNLAFLSAITSGDNIGLVKWVTPTPFQPYNFRIHLIEADRVSTPRKCLTGGLGAVLGKNPDNDNRIYDGVEIDKNGAVVAYHICDKYPNQALLSGDAKWKRVEACGKETGLPNVLHVMTPERCEQYRGVGLLAPVIESILQLRRYTESELTAAVVSSFFTIFVKFKTPENMEPLPEANRGDQVSHDPDDYEVGPGTINYMEPDEDITIAEPKRPIANFTDFVRAIATQIGASIEMPVDLLLKDFNKSYSASRAALLEAYKAFKMRRSWFASDFCDPIYEIFMSVAVASGRINAPGFFTDPLLRSAWLNCEWIGPSQGQIDPVKEVTALEKAVNNAFMTGEQATVQYSGGNYDSNVEQVAVEKKKLREALNDASVPAEDITGMFIDDEREE